jgi:hypothetical protein
MAKKVEPIDASNVIPDYLGRKVRETTITITNTGDGLSKSMAIEPRLFMPGDNFIVVLDCVVVKHGHVRNDDGDFVLEQVFRAGAAVVLDDDVSVRRMLDEAADKIARVREAQEGVSRLPYVEEILKEHELGLHESPVDGCDLCVPKKKPRARKPKAEDNVTPIRNRPARGPVKIGDVIGEAIASGDVPITQPEPDA